MAEIRPPKYKNSEKQHIHMNYFQGGTTVSSKLGIPNSFFSSQALDFRTDPAQMTVQPALVEQSGGNLNGLPLAMEQDVSGARWTVTDAGGLYRINTAGTVSKQAQLTSAGTAGLYYDQITDQLYIPGTQTVSMFGKVTSGAAGNPNFQPDNFGPSASNDPGCAQFYNSSDGFYDGGARNNIQSQAVGITPSNFTTLITNTLTNSYTVLPAISEDAGDFCFFAPDIEPFYSVAVYLTSASGAGSFNTGVTQAGSGGDNGASWSNPTNVTGSSGFATATTSGPHGGPTSTLFSDTYGFSIPTTATIVGVQVSITRTGTSGTDLDNTVQLLVSGSAAGTNKASGAAWNTVATVTYGGPTDTWGLTLTPAQVNATNFGVTLTAIGGLGDSIGAQNFQVTIYYATAGSCTLTMHDSFNNILGVATVANPQVGWNNFVFPNPVRALVQQAQTGGSATYHWHLTCNTLGAAIVATSVGGDISHANFLLFAYRLVNSANGWHPTTYFNGLLCIGNERYLSTYDFSNDAGPTNQQWQRHQLIFKSGYNVTSLTTNNQYLVIAIERRSTSTTRNYQDGQLIFWDGSTPNPNFIIDIPMGSPYGLQTFNNVTYFVCGGSLFGWSGGQTVVKIRKLSYQNTNYLGTTDTTIVNPNMLAVRFNLLEIGYPSTTTNVNLNHGVYSYGAVEITYPNSFGYDFVLSNGIQNTSTATNLKIGCVYNFVDTMYVSWQYTDANSVVHNGLDMVNNSSPVAPSWNWSSLIFDGGNSYKSKAAYRMQITYPKLPTGNVITPWYNIDRQGQVFGPPSVTGSLKTTFDLTDSTYGVRFHELQWGFIGTSVAGSTSPQIVGITMEIGTLPEEVNITANTDLS